MGSSLDDAQDTGSDLLTESAVLVPLFRDLYERLRVVLVLRGTRGLHADQISFPGGKHEADDGPFRQTALREAEEEIGLPRASVEIVDELEPVETRTTGYRVHPFLARIDPIPVWTVAAGEIVCVLTPQLTAFADPRNRLQRDLVHPRWPQTRRVEGVAIYGDHLVWGLTLRLLDSLAPRLLGGEWET